MCVAERYRVEDVLGRGGMGTVYRVHDERTGDLLALKRLALGSNDNSNAERVALFQREYHVLAQLAHPNVVKALDFGIDGDVPYYTMELLSAAEDLRSLSPLPWQRCAEILLELCSVLSVIHSRGLVHRDVTPRNVLIDPDGHCKLIDFGAMAQSGHCERVVGTPPYLAPELVQRQHVDGRSDIFALGGVAYFMLTGQHAMPAARIHDLARVWERQPRLPSELGVDVPPAFEQLVLGMLSLASEARPAQVAEITPRLLSVLGRKDRHGTAEVHAQAHLTTPKLVGREQGRKLLVAQLARAKTGHGAALLARAESGMGRSRMLEAFGLEAKLGGFVVLSTQARVREDGDFAVCRRLMALLSLTEPARAEAAAQGLESRLVGLWPPASDQVSAVGDASRLRIERQDALVAFFARLSELVPVALAVDDVLLADAPSQQVLSRLASLSRTRRMVLLASAPHVWSDRDHPALTLLRAQAEDLPLPPLRPAETEALLASVFGDSPELRRVAEWAHRVSAGRPRACMQLAAHLVEQGLARFAGGRFELPSALEPLELPQSLEQAARARLLGLDVGARTVAGLLACCSRFVPLRMSELLELCSQRLDRFETFSAVDTLTEARMVRREGDAFAIADRHLAQLVLETTGEDDSRAHHRGLGCHYRDLGQDYHGLAAYHFFQAGDLDAANPLLLEVGGLVEDSSSMTSVIARSDEGIELYRQMLAYGEQQGHAPVRLFRFRKVMLQLAAIIRPELNAYADVTLAQLRYDIGLDRWEDFAVESDPMQRLMRCLQVAKDRWEATPEAQRGLEPTVAIKEFATACALLSSTFASTQDVGAVAAIPAQLEPLRVLLPVLDIVYRMAVMTAGATVEGRDVLVEREQVTASLMEPVVGMDELTRQGSLAINQYYVAMEYALYGSERALEIADMVEAQPVYAVLGKQARQVHALVQGAQQRAQRYGEERDMLRAVGANCENHLQLAAGWQQVALYRTRDLLGLTRLARELEARAERFAGFTARVHAARAQIHMLCDEPEAALARIEEGERHAPPLSGATWREFAVMKADALVALARFDEALGVIAWADQVLRRVGDTCGRHPRMAPLRARALAGLGRFDEARACLCPVIARLLELAPDGVPLGEVYEAQALTELAAGNRAGYAEAVDRTARIFARERHPGLAARLERLRAAARRVDAERSPDGHLKAVTTALTESALATQLQTQLAGFDEQEQLCQLLALVLEEADQTAGYLYRVSMNGQLELLASRAAVTPNPALECQLNALLQAQAAELTETNTVTGSAPPTPPTLSDGTDEYTPVFLRTQGRDARVIGALALRTVEAPRLRLPFVQAVSRTVEALTTRRLSVG